jgi:hypothetical protein
MYYRAVREKTHKLALTAVVVNFHGFPGVSAQAAQSCKLHWCLPLQALELYLPAGWGPGITKISRIIRESGQMYQHGN